MIIELRYLTHQVAPNHFQEVLQFRQTLATKIESGGKMIPVVGWTDWIDVPHVIEEAVNV